MIHYLLTHFKSKFLHPPTAVGNRRHGGTGALLRVASIPPKCARLRTVFYVAAEVREKTQRVTVHQGREWILRKAREWSKARLGAVPCEACRSGQGCGAGRGRQPSAAGQAGRPALWAGQAKAGSEAVRRAWPRLPSVNSSKRLMFCTLQLSSPAKGKI